MININTPWGFSDSVREIASGITWYTTPSHGGFYLDSERYAEFRAKYPRVKLWAGARWFEEDCDWAWVVLTFPQYFDAEMIANATTTAQWLESKAA